MKWPYQHTLPDHCQPLIDRYKWWTIGVLLILTLVFAFELRDLRFENAPGKLDLPVDDPTRITRNQFEARFGGGETILIGLSFDRRIDPELVSLIRETSDRINDLPGVTSVYSIADATEPVWIPTLGVHTLRRRAAIPVVSTATDSAIQEAINSLTRQLPYANNLISTDGRSAILVLTVNHDAVQVESRAKTMAGLIDKVKETTRGLDERGVVVSYAGTPILNRALQAAMKRDLMIFGPLSICVFVVLLWWVFRSWRAVAIAMATAFMALIWSMSLLPLTATPMSIGLSMMVPLILAVSLMQAVHLLTCMLDSQGRSVTDCWRNVLIPNLLCGVTTAAGFLTIGLSEVPGIREVGLYIGTGVLISTFVVNLFLPAVMSAIGPGSSRSSTNISRSFVGRMVTVIQRAVLRNSITLIILIAMGSAALVSGVSRLRVETNHLRYLSNDRGVTDSFARIDSTFGGTLPLEILVDIPHRQSAEAVRSIYQLEDSLRSLNSLGAAYSAADFIMHADALKPEQFAILNPPLHLDKNYIPEKVWRLVETPTAGGRFVDRSDSVITMRISCRVHVSGSSRLRQLLHDVRQLLNRRLPEYRADISGLAAYFSRVAQYVVSTQIWSFAIALCFVVVLLGMLGGSLRTALVLIVVNLLPVAIVLGTMGWLGIPLDISTVMIAAIALGVVVDDTIHLIYRFSHAEVTDRSVANRLKVAFEEVGLPVLSTTLILAAGFGCLLPARFTPTAYFGGLSALVVLAAAVADLFLLPALLMLISKSSRR